MIYMNYLQDRYNSAIATSLEYPYSSQWLIENLQKEQWASLENNVDKPNHRFHMLIISNPEIKALVDFLHSENFKKSMISVVKKFNSNITASEQEMLDFGTMTAGIVKDMPGHFVGPHLDPAHVWCSGMTYLNEKQDQEKTTVFYTDANRNNPEIADNSYLKGWILPGSQGAWHEGYNNSNEPRYTLMFFFGDSRQEQLLQGAHIK